MFGGQTRRLGLSNLLSLITNHLARGNTYLLKQVIVIIVSLFLNDITVYGIAI